VTYAGMGPDFRILTDMARQVTHRDYKRIYNEYPPTKILAQDIARVVQQATQSPGVRPYGVSLLVAGWDDETETLSDGKPVPTKGGPTLYQVDPSGTYFSWKATAIGKNYSSAKTFLEKRCTDSLELEDAIHIALLTLKESIEGEMTGDSIEIGMFCAGIHRKQACFLKLQLTNSRVCT